ncbi:MAG: M15 family metallopeptidase [Syntrophobacteraceae bacterium]
MFFKKSHALIICLLLTITCSSPVSAQSGALPGGFVYVEDVIPGIQVDLRYYSNYNFVGERIDGYLKPRCVLTRETAEALKQVQEELGKFGLGLKIFDGYRPQRAVNHFIRWAEDLRDKRMKKEFYPEVEKETLFQDGYIAKKSGHSRGSTVDLTIISIDKQSMGAEVDMGTVFDLFSPLSWGESPQVGSVPRANRMLLRMVMEKHGFKPYSKEWWHFTFRQEPYPDTYFDFPIR